MGSGTCKNAGIQNSRLKNFKKRKGRFLSLRRAGVDTAKLIRAGGNAAIVYGGFAYGVAPSLLLGQRRAAAATAPEEGGGTKSRPRVNHRRRQRARQSRPGLRCTCPAHWALGHGSMECLAPNPRPAQIGGKRRDKIDQCSEAVAQCQRTPALRWWRRAPGRLESQRCGDLSHRRREDPASRSRLPSGS